MKDVTACFTGHRLIPAKQRDTVEMRLAEVVVNLIECGYRFFGAGGALGFDTMAAQTVLKLKNQHPHIRLILVLPCPSQANSWSKYDRMIYEHIKVHADKIVYTSQEYSAGCMHKRNRHLVDHSSACICYLTKAFGGTSYTVDYARTKGLSVINVAQYSTTTSSHPLRDATGGCDKKNIERIRLD